jgi:plasmid stability protein
MAKSPPTVRGASKGRTRREYKIEDAPKAQLIVRELEPRLVARLKEQAVRHGRSAEAEHRAILRQALLPEPQSSLKDLLLAMPDVGDDRDFARPRRLPGRVRL